MSADKTPSEKLPVPSRHTWFDPRTGKRCITYTLGHLAIDCGYGFEDQAVTELINRWKASQTEGS